ncbi:DUF547 domain-containing protein [bacterium]|nr:DUF547 domain-containing protein [bacterium]
MRKLFISLIFLSVHTISAQVSHALWDQLLKTYISTSGNINYIEFDRTALKNYLQTLSATQPQPNWSVDAQKAYWINAYNAFTVSLVLENYPVKSIKDIGGFFKSPWDKLFISIGGKSYTLNQIEHDILRKQFNDPRIHFAIVCASRSCPVLRREAFEPSTLNRQLDEQVKSFLRDQSKNRLASQTIRLSKIFDWFKDDFTKDGTLIDFLNQYSNIKIDQKAKIEYLEYDWSLNE